MRVVNPLFSWTHLGEGLAVRPRAKHDALVLRLHVSCSELVSAEVSMLVLGLAEECFEVSALGRLLHDFNLLGLGFVLETAQNAIEGCLVVLMAALLLHVLLHEDLRNRLHDRRLIEIVAIPNVQEIRQTVVSMSLADIPELTFGQFLMSTLVELMTLLTMNLFNYCLCLVRSLKVRVTRVIFVGILML